MPGRRIQIWRDCGAGGLGLIAWVGKESSLSKQMDQFSLSREMKFDLGSKEIEDFWEKVGIRHFFLEGFNNISFKPEFGEPLKSSFYI
jgi:hypothetical protein